MNYEFKQLKLNAKERLRATYKGTVLACFIFSVIVSGFSIRTQFNDNYIGVGLALGISIAVLLADIFLLNPISVGMSRYLLEARVGKPKASRIFCVFGSKHYINVVKIMLVRDIYLVLWSLLFIIPGIIKGYAYLPIPYLLAEKGDLKLKETFAISNRMMSGYKFDTFVLQISFIFWFILSLFTLGLLAIFYVTPYYSLTVANFYCMIRDKREVTKDLYGNENEEDVTFEETL